MKNIQFNYLYRDAGNYKVHGSIIFSNPNLIPSIKIEKEIRKNLIDTEYFYPETFGIPQLNFDDYDLELNGSWNEFTSIEEAIEKETDKRTIDEFLSLLTIKS